MKAKVGELWGCSEGPWGSYLVLIMGYQNRLYRILALAVPKSREKDHMKEWEISCKELSRKIS